MPSIDDRTLGVAMAWVAARMAADATPGLALAITDREGLLHEQAFGLADVAANRPMRTTDLLQTGSIGKSFTAIALLQLAAEGELDLHAPVQRYLPWFELPTRFAPFTLHHLLSHTAGITSGIDFAPSAPAQVWALRESEAAAEPGTYFHYSNLGYKVLGMVLETVGGEPYGPALQRRILDPLGMRAAIPTITNADRERHAVAYTPLFDDRPWWPGRPLRPATWFETDTADGCLAMPMPDLATYLRMLLNRGQGVLDPASFDRFTQRVIQVTDDPHPIWYGYGLFSEEVRGHTCLGHSGGMVGFYARMIGDLDLGIGVTAAVNGPGTPSRIAMAVLTMLRAALEGEAVEPPPIEDPCAVDLSLAGDFVADGGPLAGRPERFALELRGSGLNVFTEDGEAPLRAFWGDAVVVDGFGLDRFQMTPIREGETVAGLRNGDLRYVRAGALLPPEPPLPVELAPFVGHYRSHNPWTPDFRVVAGDGRLWMIVSGDADGLADRQELVPLPNGWFRCGEDERIPERVRFDAVVDGRALIADLNGCPFYRVDAP